MKLLWIVLLSISAHAVIPTENGEILPLNNTKYPLKQLIKDYAQMMKLNVTYPANMLSDKITVHLELNTKTSKEEFKTVFYEMLAFAGFSPQEDNNVLWIQDSKDTRYLSSKVYTNHDFPKNASYSTVIYRLKYPLSSEVAMNLRPFISRYGRVIDLSDGKTIILHDRGDNTKRLISTIKTLDIELAYKNLIAPPIKNEEEEPNPLTEKVLELELKNKLLEKKYLETQGQTNA